MQVRIHPLLFEVELDASHTEGLHFVGLCAGEVSMAARSVANAEDRVQVSASASGSDGRWHPNRPAKALVARLRGFDSHRFRRHGSVPVRTGAGWKPVRGLGLSRFDSCRCRNAGMVSMVASQTSNLVVSVQVRLSASEE